MVRSLWSRYVRSTVNRHGRPALSFVFLEDRLTPANLSAAFTDLSHFPAAVTQQPPSIATTQARELQIDTAGVVQELSAVPSEPAYLSGTAALEYTLPAPDGTNQRFQVIDAPVMAPGLAAQFPDIHTYQGRGLDDKSATLRMDVTPLGFHVMVISAAGTWMVEPYNLGQTGYYNSFYRSNSVVPVEDLAPDLDLPGGDGVANKGPGGTGGSNLGPTANRSGTQLRTYRLAVAATGEYTQAVGGGTVAGGQAAIVTAVNRVDGIYETEFAIRMVLVANNNQLVYTDGNSDPYSNNNGGAMLGQNQTVVDNTIGPANYDIGHVFSTGGGGVAYIRSVGTDIKAGGVTGLPNPIGDDFYVDYVAHEMGHQFGANHPFNTSMDPNRNAGTAYEPGSGSTIMAYAGLEGNDDLQPHSDPYFNTSSFDEIIAWVDDGIPNVGVRTDTGNKVPDVSAGQSGYVIPTGTPFALTATGSDGNGDTLTYSWEERDLGPANLLTDPDNGSSPLFRVLNPTEDPTRTFPRLSDLVNNTTIKGEKLPTVAHSTMAFRVTARDSRMGGGGVNTDDMSLSVVDTGAAFTVTAPNTNVTWTRNQLQTVTWNVAGTTGNGINAATVNILLSTDGGLTYPIVLASGVPNNGSASVTTPAVNTTTARVKVQPVGNIFFDISNTDFTIVRGAGNVPPVITSDGGGPTAMLSVFENTTAVTTVTATDGDGDPVTYSISGGADAGKFTIDPSTGALKFVTAPNFEVPSDANTDNLYLVTVQASDGMAADTQDLTITVGDVNEAPVFTLGATQKVNEDSGAQTVSGFVTNVKTGPNPEAGQTVTFTATTASSALFSGQPYVDQNGTLYFTPAKDAAGTAVVLVTGKDNGGTANGGVDSTTKSFVITINPINDPPVFTIHDLSVADDAGQQTIQNFATGISGGPPNEAGQSVTFTLTNDNNALFSVQPALTANGILTFTVAGNVLGSATVTVTGVDNGGTANGGMNTTVKTFILTVQFVDDPPSFTIGGPQTVTEDAGPQTVPNFATNITAGPPNESNETVSFTVTADDPSKFSSQPAIAPDGTLTYTFAPNANGTATVTVVAVDYDAAHSASASSPPQTFTLTATAVNDAPTFTLVPSVTTTEDAGPQIVPGVATGSPGPADEAGQSVIYTVTNNNPTLFSVQPTLDSNGTLRYTPAANANGTAAVTVMATDDGGGSPTAGPQTFTLAVTAVNDTPTFTLAGNQATTGEAGQQQVPGFVTSVSAGPPDEAGQTVTYQLFADRADLFLVPPAIDVSGTLTYTPAPLTNGVATITVIGSDNGNPPASTTRTFTIRVTSFADPVAADGNTAEDTLSDGIVIGPGVSNSPVAYFQITNIRNGTLFQADGVTPIADGQFITVAQGQAGVRFLPATNLNDATTPGGFGFRVQNSTTADAGGLVRNPTAVNVFVAAVNDPPTFTTTTAAASEDAGPQAITGYATAVGGPAAATDEVGQTFTYSVAVIGSDGLAFSQAPAIGPDGTLTFQSAPDSFGSATIRITVTDNQGGQTTGDRTIIVTPVNDPPTETVLQPVTNSSGGGTRTIANVLALSSGAANEHDTLTVTATVVSTTGRVIFTSGPSIDANGTLTYMATLGSLGTATVAVSVGDGQATSPVQFLTINVDAGIGRAELVGVPQFAAGTDVGGAAVTLYNADASTRFTKTRYPTTEFGVRTAVADFTGDGVGDVVIGSGPGRSSFVTILDGVTQAVIYSGQPFEAAFTGGIYVAAGDLNGDGIADLVVTPDEGGGTRVQVYDGKTFNKIADFMGIEDANFRGGMRAAVGDVNGDGPADLVVSAGFGGGPRVAAFDGPSVAAGTPKKLFNDFFAFEQTLRNGVYVTVGDIDGDGYAEIIAGGGPSGGPRVTAFSGRALMNSAGDVLTPVVNFFAGDPSNRGGIRVAVKNLDGDTKADLVVGAGTGAGSTVTGYLGSDLITGSTTPKFQFDAFEDFDAGIYVG